MKMITTKEYICNCHPNGMCIHSSTTNTQPCYHTAMVILQPHSASSYHPLRSSNRLDLLVPRSRTAMAQSRSFASIGPSLWNALSPSVRSKILSGSLSSSFAFLKTCLFSRGLAHWERFCTVHPMRGALEMLKYNTIRLLDICRLPPSYARAAVLSIWT